MPTLKAYTLGNNGFVDAAIIEMLGDKPHIRQAHVIIAAPAKKAAAQLFEATGHQAPSMGDPDFRQDTGSSVMEAMRDAGLLDQPGVYATSMQSGDGRPLVRINEGRQAEVIGTLHREGWKLRFEAVES